MRRKREKNVLRLIQTAPRRGTKSTLTKKNKHKNGEIEKRRNCQRRFQRLTLPNEGNRHKGAKYACRTKKKHCENKKRGTARANQKVTQKLSSDWSIDRAKGTKGGVKKSRGRSDLIPKERRQATRVGDHVSRERVPANISDARTRYINFRRVRLDT